VGGVRTIVLAVIVVAVAAAAAGVANLALLGYASDRSDPVGRLVIQRGLPPAPADVIRPRERDRHDGGDD
jgi:type IV secretory pathway protease TraF